MERIPPFSPEIPSQKDEQLPQPTPDQNGGGLTLKIKGTFDAAREKVFSFAKHKGLKVKEYFGKLNQEEFDELLSIDFQEQLQDNPPIESVFSPEAELARIRSLPKEQKREALGKFKENFAKQKEALANCRVFIERCIEFNHDVPKEKLVGMIEKFGKQYGFTDEQKQIAEILIDGYCENRQRAIEIRKRYSDDTALVSELSNVEFDSTAKFDVSTGPMSIDIITDGFNAGRLFQNSKDVLVKFSSAGFAARSRHEKPILYIVINKSNFWQGQLRREGVRVHEYEHQKNRLFRKIFDKQSNPDEESLIFLQYESERDPEIKQELLESFFRLWMQWAFQHAKDEVIAMKKDRDYYNYDFFFKKDNSSYDYLAYIRNWEHKKDDPLWRETSERVLVDEYRKIFESAVSAFDDLVKQGRYTREEVIAMFADKSLPEWPKAAKRLLEQKEK